eukprot:254943-Chlamydomonas_euryale.AAC.6
MTSCEDTHASMELYGSSAGSSCAIFSRSSSSIGGMSPHDLSSESSLSNVASDASDLEQGSSRGVVRFNPDEYLAAHKKALLERSRKGVPGHRMKALYRCASRPTRGAASPSVRPSLGTRGTHHSRHFQSCRAVGGRTLTIAAALRRREGGTRATVDQR